MKNIVEFGLETLKNVFATTLAISLSITYYAYNLVVVDPLKYFYFFGWFAGTPRTDLCAQLSGGDARFWNSSVETRGQCDIILMRQFDSVQAWVFTGMYFSTMLILVFALIMRCTILSPIIKAVRRNSNPNSKKKDDVYHERGDPSVRGSVPVLPASGQGGEDRRSTEEGDGDPQAVE